MSQLENYKECLETFNKRCESDKEFQALAESDLTKALNEVGITDIKDFVDFTIAQGRAKMSDDEMDSIAGGHSSPGALASMTILQKTIEIADQERARKAGEMATALQASLVPVYGVIGTAFGNVLSAGLNG